MKRFRWLSMLLSLTMVLGLVGVAPVQAKAEDVDRNGVEQGEVIDYLDTFSIDYDSYYYDPVKVEGGYTYKDTYGGTETTVDLYKFAILPDVKTVDIIFWDGNKLIYNYDADGETFLDGWLDDPINGVFETTCAVDADENGVYDILQVQAPYTQDADGNWGGGEVLYAITFEASGLTPDEPAFAVHADGKRVRMYGVDPAGYTYKDTYMGTETTVDLYYIPVPAETEEVELYFGDPQLVYNYDTDGETWLAGWYDDATVGFRYVTCKVDADENGVYDVLQIQAPYTQDPEDEENWGGGELLYAMTFYEKTINDVVDVVYNVGDEGYAGYPAVTENGYTYTDNYGNESVVNLYTYTIPEDIEYVDLYFWDGDMLVYNYDVDGETYLDCWNDDLTESSSYARCLVDSDGNGVYDVLVVQDDYTLDENDDLIEGEILYAITFQNPVCKAPTNVKVEAASTGLKVSWKKAARAEKYVVYRKEGSGKYKKVKTTTGTSYTDTKVTNGSKYTYYVKAINHSGQASKASKEIASYYVKSVAMSKLTSTKAGKMDVKWGKNTKATGYEITYAKKSNFSDAKTVTIKKAATVSKTIASLTKGQKYYVKVRAYKTVSKTKYYSAWSAKKSVTIKK